MHDLVIKGGTVVDGTGAPGFQGDVAVKDGVIVEVGKVGERASRVIDADGLLVTPGFVDIHTHLDGQAMWDPLLSPSFSHGVTTVVTGNCGVGFAPVRADKHEFLIGLFEGVEDIPGAALAQGMPWGRWETFPQYMDVVDAIPRAIDVGMQIGHGPVRVYVMGDRGLNNEPATSDDIAAMAALVREAFQVGALGFTTSRTPFHKSIWGDVLPGTTASEEEIFGLMAVLGELGTGVIELSPNGSAGEDIPVYEREIGWMRRISAATGRPVTWGVVQYDNEPDHWRRLFGLAAEGVSEGARLYAQTLGRAHAGLIGHQTTHPFMYKPTYLELNKLPFDEKIARLRDPDVRRKVIDEAPLPPPATDAFASLRKYTMSRMYPLGDPPEYEPSPDQSIEAAAAKRGVPPEEHLYDVMLQRDGLELVNYISMNYSEGNLDACREMLLHPQGIVGLGDAGAHCGFICDGGVFTYLLTHWARDRTRGERIPLETVVRNQTAATANLFGLTDRGELRPGKKADVNVIDFDRLTSHPPVIVHDLPGGGRRLNQEAEGYVATVVAGEVIKEDDKDTGMRPGRLIRGAR
jgi:N-acyl-D-aspartate/D-glutamate deacylase